ncbi:MAG: sialidase family protein, partial [Steroidobacteraceae bacterium]
MVFDFTRLSLTGFIAAAALACAAQAQQPGPTTRPANNVLAHALDIESGLVAPRPNEPRLSSGALYSVLGASGALTQRASASINGAEPALDFRAGRPTQGCSNVFSSGTRTNTRVNQDCSLRRQAEEVVAINPLDPDNLIAGQNDSRIGFNHCGYDFSMDGGKTWGDMIPPFYQFTNKLAVTFDACSDPTATFDGAGNAYIGGVLFEINYAASAFVVAKSNAGINGAFYHTPNAALPFQTYRDTPLGVVANDNNPNIFNDKEFIVADAGRASPKANNVYATWTRFDFATGAGVGGHSPIYFSQSTDGGATWSAGIEISGVNTAACTVASGETSPNACDQDQGSHPIVGPDGTVYVAFGNGNTPLAGVNQHMVVSCGPGNDCSTTGGWTAPVKISDDYGKQPSGPVAATGCAVGRQCLPPNGYRLDDFVEGSISVDRSGKLYFVWADFRNGAANCNPNGSAAAATTPCDNDVFYSYSTNGGATWSAAVNLTPKAKFGANAQWMPWSGVTADGRTLWVAYYDRSYGNCETTGCNDITAAAVSRPATNSATVRYQRVTTASMPNLVVANNPIEAG